MNIIKSFDPWRSPLCPCPPKYTLNPYSGCGFKCIYCYITSYIRDAYNPRPKKDIIKRLKSDLDKLDRHIVIAISYSSDPYTPPEGDHLLMRKILSLLSRYDVSVLIATKSNLVLRDIDILKKIDVVVSMTITTLDKELSRIIEPYAPSPSSRLEALRRLSENGIPTSLRIDPIIPYLTDDFKSIEELINISHEYGVKHIVSSIYKAKPDSFKRIINIYKDLKDRIRRLYDELGLYMYGYKYPPYQYRYKILSFISRYVKNLGMKFNTCREGMRFLDSPDSYCDASHMLKYRFK